MYSLKASSIIISGFATTEKNEAIYSSHYEAQEVNKNAIILVTKAAVTKEK